MSKKLFISLASVGILSVVAFVTYQGNIGGLRSDSLSTTSNMRTESHGCALYVPNDGGYFDLRGNYLSRDNQADANQKDILIYHTTENGEYQQFTIPFCTEADISEVGYIDGDTGRFIREEKVPDVLPGSDIPATTTPTTPPVKQLSQLEILLNAWNNAKTTLANLETELKTLTDSKKALTDRKTVLEKKTGTESITVITARLAAIEKELTAQLTTLTKNTKLKSVDEYEPAKVQALADFDAIAAEMRPLENQLTTLNAELVKLKSDFTALGKIKPQTTQTKTDIANKNKEITAKNTEVTKKKAEIAKIQTRKTAAQTKYTTLKSYETKYIYTFRTKVSALNKEKAELTSKLARLTAELADIKTKLGDRLPALPELIEQQKTTVNEAQTTYSAYVATIPTNGTGNNGTGVNQECDNNTDENCEKDNEKGGTDNQKDCSDIEEKIAEKNQEIQNIERESQYRREDLNEMRQKLLDLQDEINDLVAKYKSGQIPDADKSATAKKINEMTAQLQWDNSNYEDESLDQSQGFDYRDALIDALRDEIRELEKALNQCRYGS